MEEGYNFHTGSKITFQMHPGYQQMHVIIKTGNHNLDTLIPIGKIVPLCSHSFLFLSVFGGLSSNAVQQTDHVTVDFRFDVGITRMSMWKEDLKNVV
jgi:hypothetical protein